MCGIAAVYSYARRAAPADLARLHRSCGHMQCRGPDDAGVWIRADQRVALGHRRLAILDPTPRGAQPMRTADGQQVLSFNGEIYNFRALRQGLEARGHQFHSDSDTEVLLQLYVEHGPAFVRQLRGMFALALWDEARGGLLLARDPFGIKPLYYADDGTAITVASEVKALLAGGGIDTSPEPAGHAGFFLWGAVPEPYTLYRGIRALPAGSTMWINADGARAPRSFADVGALLARGEQTTRELEPGEAGEQLHAALLDSVRHHLIADVDVGIFLSSGRDSTVLAALAAEAGQQLRTVTLGFAEYRGTADDETPLAEAVARQYGAEHRTVWVARANFREELPTLLARMDQPTTDGVNSYFVARAAASVGLKVALSGVGGDELFGGYADFRQIPRLVATVGRVPGSRVLGRAVRATLAPLFGTKLSPKYASLLEYAASYGDAYLLRRALFLPWELPAVLDPDLARDGLAALQESAALAAIAAGPRTGFRKVSALEASHYMRNQLLRDTDWASMSHSLEVRTPLVDWPLWETVTAMTVGGKPLRKEALARAARPALPVEVRQRPKTGFSVPIREWMLEGTRPPADRGLRGWARSVYAHFTLGVDQESSDRHWADSLHA
jgi:asparagine synthase (glutamine-hydrolysing)